MYVHGSLSLACTSDEVWAAAAKKKKSLLVTRSCIYHVEAHVKKIIEIDYKEKMFILSHLDSFLQRLKTTFPFSQDIIYIITIQSGH